MNDPDKPNKNYGVVKEVLVAGTSIIGSALTGFGGMKLLEFLYNTFISNEPSPLPPSVLQIGIIIPALYGLLVVYPDIRKYVFKKNRN